MPSYIPGGSSSGSAVAVAAELVDFAIGIVLFFVDEMLTNDTSKNLQRFKKKELKLNMYMLQASN